MSPLGRLTGSVHTQHGHVVVAVNGEIDLATSDQFRALLDAALAFGAPQVRVDMTNVGFIDAQALGILAQAATRMNLAGGQLVVNSASPQSFRVFQISRLVGVLSVEQAGTAPELPAPGVEALAMSPQLRNLLDAALRLVVTTASKVVTGADGVSITLPRQGEFVTIAASDDVVLGMDHDQYDTDEGPCLDAARQGLRIMTTSLKEEARWPEFTPKAMARGIESIVSTPITSDERVLGALNVYSRQPGGLAEREVEWVEHLATGASTVLTRGQEAVGEKAFLDDLQSRLASRDIIAVAQGVLMQREGLSQVDAHSALIAQSRRSSQGLVDVCAEVLATVVAHEVRPGQS